MVPDDSETGFVLVDGEESTDFVLLEDEQEETGLVAVPDADARYPGLQPVESIGETGFVIVEEPDDIGETDFVIVEDDGESDLPARHPDRSFPGIDTR
ncbi:hypothetical protein [Natranaeroarchaeum sulfidigenes]|uniref:Uncharacterized protein n=1 Tax=Natranaeroarchaeum sulfidigenes TaxID=2784880 RepID=A0A897MMA5_9EURY|nr:hypothetical protein [Natranaeroarchaeum sulfidigenes]QSG03330.1 hypothetical protein AArcS_2132 [Natranaeroarchaeum sulfidigenes]